MSFEDLDDDQVAIIHELILRGLRETSPADQEYSETYDDFCEAVDIPLRIGDQPERVQDLWGDIFESQVQNLREFDE